MNYLRVDKLSKRIDDKVILNSISLDIEKGKFIALLGPSGCGKSTLLRCIAGLDQVTQGNVYLDSINITQLPLSKRNIGMIFQQYSLFPTKTVFDNIAYGLRIKKQPKAEIQDKVSHALEMVSLSGVEGKYPDQLSGGEQQRVALARSLVIEPKVVLFDEPFSAIDAKLRKDLQIKLREIHNTLNMTSIFVTHDRAEAMLMADVIYLMNKGEVVQFGSAENLYKTPKNTFVASFIADHNIISKDNCNILFNHAIPDNYLIVASENVVLYPDTNAIGKGKVVNATFLGSYTQVLLNYKGFEIHCSANISTTEKFCIGEDIPFSIDFAKCTSVSE